MTYEDMAEWIEDFLNPNDFDNFEEFVKEVQTTFSSSYEIAESLAKVFWQEKRREIEEPEIFFEEEIIEEEPEPKPKPKPKEVKLTQTQETDIQNVVQNEDLTKREVSIRTLEIVNKPFSLQQFYDETGMVQSTARRELGQAVKRGEIERVSRGVYRRL
jgi:Fic family protein